MGRVALIRIRRLMTFLSRVRVGSCRSPEALKKAGWPRRVALSLIYQRVCTHTHQLCRHFCCGLGLAKDLTWMCRCSNVWSSGWDTLSITVLKGRSHLPEPELPTQQSTPTARFLLVMAAW